MTPTAAADEADAAGRRTPAVSIGMPVNNGERFVEEALASLLAQTFDDYELIVVDNGSTDRTPEICRGLAERDRRIRFVRSDVNRGAAWSFNRVFELSSGRYFKWAAYDDLCAPSFVERCVAALEESPAAVLAHPKTRLIDDEGRVLRDHDDGLDLRSPEPHRRLGQLVLALAYANPVYGVIRASALRRTRLLGSYPSADYVLLAELALLGTFLEVPERLFLRRIHPAMSRSANPTGAQAAAWFDPRPTRRRFRTEGWRLFGEHFVAIARTPIAPGARVRCAWTFAHVGGRRYRRQLATELARGLATTLRLS